MTWEDEEEGYYDFFTSKSDPAHRVGWRSEVCQTYRYLVVMEYVDEHESVIDVGSGTGAFAAALRKRGKTGRYVGADPYPHPQQIKHIPNATFHEADIRVLDVECDVAVAIGALVSNNEEHLLSIEELLDELLRVSKKAFVLVALDELVMAEMAWADPALHGTTVKAIRAWAAAQGLEVCFDETLAPRELVAVFQRSLRDVDQTALFQETYRLAPRSSPSDRARLAHDLGRRDEVERIAEEHPEDELIQMMLDLS